MEKTELEDEIAEWLERQGMEDGYEMAENFADFGFNGDGSWKENLTCSRPTARAFLPPVMCGPVP